MKIAIGSDHGGFELKEYLKKYMEKKNIDYKDFGTFSKESCDYPTFSTWVSSAVRTAEFDKGILICTSGIGMSIAANKIENIRAALCYNKDAAKFARLHNDANILVLGAKYVKKGSAKKILDVFLDTKFEGGRHKKRIASISSLEKRVL